MKERCNRRTREGGSPLGYYALEEMERRALLRDDERYRHPATATGQDEEEDGDEDEDEEDHDEDEQPAVYEQATSQPEATDNEATQEAPTVPESADVSKTEDEKTQPSAEAVGSPKKQSFGSKKKGTLAKKVSRIVSKIQSAVDTAARFNRRASALESPQNAQETEDIEYQRRMKSATQSEMDSLDAEDAFQEAQFVAREARGKVLQERLSKQADRQMGR
jgi:hypothetical protein